MDSNYQLKFKIERDYTLRAKTLSGDYTIFNIENFWVTGYKDGQCFDVGLFDNIYEALDAANKDYEQRITIL